MLGELGVTVPHEASRPPAASSEPKIVKPIARPPRASSCRPPADKRATIVVPTTPPPPGRSESGSVSRWREMPLSPTHPKYVTRQKARHESVFTEPADLMSPLGKTVYVKGPVGRLKEYEVYDATIPCNNAYNRMLSQKKAEETAMKVEAEQRQCDLAVAADLQSLRKEKEYVVAKRLKQKNEIEAWNEEKKARDEQKRRQDEYLDQKSRAIQDENYSRAVQDKLNELERQRSSKAQLRAELQRSMQEKHERLLQEEAARLKPHINGFEIGVGYHVTKEELKLRGDKLRKAWAEQQAQKAAEMEVERHRDYRLAMNTARAAELERQAMFEEKLATRDRNEQTRFEQQLFMKQKAERDNEDRHRLMQADRQRVERDRQENLAAREYEATMSQIKKETFKESLAHQMDVKAAADAIKAAKDSGPHMAHNGLGMREERKILFRCPITNQLLPPTAFNIKTTTSRPRIVVP
eukprot:TRINITY_DN20908_c0_g1_i1.p1 TRINITY_DN20908_c0_g1~~TRINITY_DN20908_c0_g1_i1.p1  ORF type:complete len:482 (+),score=176.21 TRINITY_DN20908_c0_g1_i1:47-1447(+)